MTFWRGETLAQRLPSLVAPYDASRIDCSAYTLSVGSEIYVTPNHEVTNPSINTVRKLSRTDNFTIPSGQFGFIITEEIIEVPDDAMAFISMKTFIKFQGLINASGFHVDPGYKGRLIFSVFNAGPSSIHLKQGLPLFLIWYASLDGSTQMKKTGIGMEEIPPKLVHSIDGRIHSAHSLSEGIKNIEKDHNKIRTNLAVNNWAIGLLTLTIIGTAVAVVRPDIVGLKNSNPTHDSNIQQTMPHSNNNNSSPPSPAIPPKPSGS